MKVELITTGTELIIGQVVNTHVGYISKKIMPLGLRLERNITVPDGEAIRDAVKESLARADIILVTGGLGPTSDDITRDIVAEIFEAPLEHVEEIWKGIEDRLCSRHITPVPLMKSQALVPRGAKWLPNDAGTAPGLYFSKEEKHLICLPGPPFELYPMFEKRVLPILQALVPAAQAPHIESFRIIGIGESRVQETIEASLREKFPGIEIGYCARYGEVDLRLITRSEADLHQAAKLVVSTFGDNLYAFGEQTMEEVVIDLARQAGKKIATAESCTGGMVAHRLTNVPGASAVLDRGWVTYSNEAKMDELRVRADTLEKYGAVSRETAHEMALGALELSGADLAVSITGIAGPSGGTDRKPVGLACFGLALLDGQEPKITTVERQLVQKRDPFKQMASQAALDMLRRSLLFPS